MDQLSVTRKNSDVGLRPQASEGSSRPSVRGELHDEKRLVADHELLRCIGHGSYGEVWLAKNVIGTLRAVKFVYRRTFEKDEHFEREFKGVQSFEPVSRAHEGFVDVLQIGRNDEDGYFFYVMELADDGLEFSLEATGASKATTRRNEELDPDRAYARLQAYKPRTLRSDLCSRGPLPIAECLTIATKLASALEYLHAQGLVHRDIKPSNIIFVDGQPKLADIGLVTSIDDARSMVGTAGYIAPEGPGTPQADIYSLGKVLYEAAFGKDRQEFPQLPADLESRTDHARLLELNEVILKASEGNLLSRYLSAEQMRRDLELLQRGKSLKRLNQMRHLWHLSHRAGVWLMAGLAILSLVALVDRFYHQVPGARAEKRSTNEVANAFYDRGVAYFDKLLGTNAQMAAECFEEAVQADPNFAQAYASLADVCTWHTDTWNADSKRLLPRAKKAALQALKLDSTLASPHCVLATYHAVMEWDWRAADEEAQLAMKLDRYAASLHVSFAEGLRIRGKMDQALKELVVAQSLDPRSITIALRLAGFLVDAGKFDEGLRQIELVSAMDPSIDMSGPLEEALCALNRYPEAVQAQRRWQREPNPERDGELKELARAVEVEGASAWWHWELAHSQKSGDRYEEACAHAQLGETNAAITCLQKDLDDHMWRLAFSVMTDWRLNPVRSDARFSEILKAIGLK